MNTSELTYIQQALERAIDAFKNDARLEILHDLKLSMSMIRAERITVVERMSHAGKMCAKNAFTEEDDKLIMKLIGEGKSRPYIAKFFEGKSPNSITGRVHRLRLKAEEARRAAREGGLRGETEALWARKEAEAGEGAPVGMLTGEGGGRAAVMGGGTTAGGWPAPGEPLAAKIVVQGVSPAGFNGGHSTVTPAAGRKSEEERAYRAKAERDRRAASKANASPTPTAIAHKRNEELLAEVYSVSMEDLNERGQCRMTHDGKMFCGETTEWRKTYCDRHATLMFDRSWKLAKM